MQIVEGPSTPFITLPLPRYVQIEVSLYMIKARKTRSKNDM